MIKSFPKVTVKGSGKVSAPPSKVLDTLSKVGDIVHYFNGGHKLIGELIEWDGSTAIMLVKGEIVSRLP